MSARTFITFLSLLLCLSFLSTGELFAEKKAIGVISTNDFHGYLDGKKKELYKIYCERSSGVTSPITLTKPVVYRVGGAELISGYMKEIKKGYGEDNWLLVDAGDVFQGTMVSNTYFGQSVISFMNYLGYTTAAIGNHEFDFGRSELLKRIAESTFPWLVSNLYSEATDLPIRWKNTKRYLITKKNGVKVGILGLATPESKYETDTFAGLEFKDMKDSIERWVPEMRERGAEVIVVVAHGGGTCKTDSNGRYPDNPSYDITDLSSCDMREEIFQAVSSLPTGYVDLIVSGHSHYTYRKVINGIPIMQSGGKGEKIGRATIYYDTETGERSVDITKPAVHVVPFTLPRLCKDLNLPVSNMPPVYNGNKIVADRKVYDLLKPYRAPLRETLYTEVARLDRSLKKYYSNESGVGNLVTDIVRDATAGGADVVMLPSGGIRESLYAGSITRGDLFEIFPFGDKPVLVRIKGRYLKEIFQIGTSGAGGVVQLSGMYVRADTTIQKRWERERDDINGNGRFDGFENRRLEVVRVGNVNGPEIDDNTTYKLITTEYTAYKSSSYGSVFRNEAKVPAKDIQVLGKLPISGVLYEWFKQKARELGAVPMLKYDDYTIDCSNRRVDMVGMKPCYK